MATSSAHAGLVERVIGEQGGHPLRHESVLSSPDEIANVIVGRFATQKGVPGNLAPGRHLARRSPVIAPKRDHSGRRVPLEGLFCVLGYHLNHSG